MNFQDSFFPLFLEGKLSSAKRSHSRLNYQYDSLPLR